MGGGDEKRYTPRRRNTGKEGERTKKKEMDKRRIKEER
jgi:DUF4097 and DUF4098 domain-containing protein YvlB